LDQAKVEKIIFRAVYDLKGLEDNLRIPVEHFYKRKLTLSKAYFSYYAIDSYLDSNHAMTTLADGEGLSKLPASLRPRVEWLDALFTQLQELNPRLDKAWVMAKKGYEGQEDKVKRACKAAAKEVRRPPRDLAKMVAKWNRGEEPPKDAMELIALLPFTLLCWGIADQVDIAHARMPR
jgi:hypothetical protein